MKTQKVCHVCNREFSSYSKTQAYCSNACRSEALVKRCDHDSVVSFYLSGMSMSEVAHKLGISTKPVVTILRRRGVESRKQKPRNQTGEKNPRWKGASASYSAFHFRVENKFGKPKVCNVCGESSESKTYDWANLTGDYQNVNDYKRMCRSCHRKYDNRRRGCGLSVQS